MASLTYRTSIVWIDAPYVSAVPFLDTDNISVGDPCSFNSTGIELCDDGDVDDVTFMGLSLSKYTTGLHGTSDYISVAIICHSMVRLSTAAVTKPGQMFQFGDDGRGVMLTAGSAAGGYGWAKDYAASSVTYPIIMFNALYLSAVDGHLFEDAAT